MAADYLTENHKINQFGALQKGWYTQGRKEGLKQNKNQVNAYLKRFSNECPKESGNYFGFSFTTLK